MKLTTQLNHFKNPNYSVGAGFLKSFSWYVINALLFNSAFHSYSFKVFLLKMFGAQVGNNVLIKPYVNIKYPWKLIIADHVWIGEQVWIDNIDIVQIGNHVCISQGALLLCGNHNYKKTAFDLMTGSIILEDGVWIGAKSIVGPGVVCKSHSILSLMSVATSNLEPYTIYRGNPAQIVKERIIE
jgi:putative colanic acid biosynthesis acetyltransferase WcaF